MLQRKVIVLIYHNDPSNPIFQKEGRLDSKGKLLHMGRFVANNIAIYFTPVGEKPILSSDVKISVIRSSDMQSDQVLIEVIFPEEPTVMATLKKVRIPGLLKQLACYFRDFNTTVTGRPYPKEPVFSEIIGPES